MASAEKLIPLRRILRAGVAGRAAVPRRPDAGVLRRPNLSVLPVFLRDTPARC